MKRFHWKLFALSTLSFSVSIENFFFVKDVAVNFKMSQMYVSHSRVGVDLGKILQVNVVAPRTKQLN